MGLTELHNPREGVLRVAGFMSRTGSNLVKVIGQEKRLDKERKRSPYHVAMIFSDDVDRSNALNVDEMKNRLKEFKEEEIVFSPHAEEQAEFRGIDLKEIRKNIVNPEKLVFVEEQRAKNKREKKYNCYFAYSENYHHRYIIVLNGKVIIVTIISINRMWQKAVEGKK